MDISIPPQSHDNEQNHILNFVTIFAAFHPFVASTDCCEYRKMLVSLSHIDMNQS